MSRLALLMCLALALTGCAAQAPASDAFPADVPQELKVRNPKDARGIPACDLLARAQLVALGLDPATAQQRVDGLAETCLWYYTDGSTYASIGISTDPRAEKLPEMWRGSRDDPSLRIFEVAGHPVLWADNEPDRECNLSVGVADLQNLAVGAYYDRRPRPDPCAQSRRMAELILSNLPPLR